MAFDKKHLFRNELQQLGNFATSLSHPVRARILELLTEHHALSTLEISRFTPLHRTTITRHVLQMYRLGIIDYEEVFPHIKYQLNYQYFENYALLAKKIIGQILEKGR